MLSDKHGVFKDCATAQTSIRRSMSLIHGYRLGCGCSLSLVSVSFACLPPCMPACSLLRLAWLACLPARPPAFLTLRDTRLHWIQHATGNGSAIAVFALSLGHGFRLQCDRAANISMLDVDVDIIDSMLISLIMW